MSSLPGESFEDWKARRARHGQVWLQLLCAAIQAPNPLFNKSTGQNLAPEQVADTYLVAYQEREAAGWEIDPEEENDGDQ